MNYEEFVENLAEDRSNIGTPQYKGIAYFWNHEYRHYLRDSSDKARRDTHKALLACGLSLVEKSAAHKAIILKHSDPKT